MKCLVIGLDGEKLMLDSHLEALVSYLANKNMALALESEPGGKGRGFRFKIYVYAQDGHMDELECGWRDTIQKAALCAFNLVMNGERKSS